MYEQETKEALLERMKKKSPEDIDTRQGSITYDLLSPAAIELAEAYIQLDNVLKFGFAGPEQPSEYLDARAAELGLERKPSVKAVGEVTFTGPKDTVIPAGTVVTTGEENPIAFVTTKAGKIETGSVTLPAEAQNGGKSGNIAAGRIRLLLGNLTGIVTSVTNNKAFDNGADVESDELFLQRYYDRVRRPATSGNAWHYRQWALEVKGIGDVKVFPTWKGNGTVRLVLLSSDKRPPKAETLKEVKDAVEARRPIGADVTVDPAEQTFINVSAKLKLDPGTSLEAVKAEFTAKLSDFLSKIAFKDEKTVVQYNRVLGLLLAIETVDDFDELKVNGKEENLSIANDHVAVPGEVTFHVWV